jgi:triphosphoribosyl-dephospho-CoA synthase
VSAAAPASRGLRAAAPVGEEEARRIGAAALAALREELRTAPKPGLVAPGEPGAHADMDERTFAASLGALRPFFPAAARAGIEGAPFESLRALGLDAERAMLRATAGVNTHRGAIFTLGLLAAAAGRLAAEGAPARPPALREALRRHAPALRALPRPAGSHGAVVARRHGVGGARAEAAAGFPHLFEVALPALEEALRRGAAPRAAAVHCLMSAIAVLADTNVLYRAGPGGLAFARAAARSFLAAGGVHRAGWEAEVGAIHRAFVARRLSPGGSADLLAAALFVRRLGRAPGGAG